MSNESRITIGVIIITVALVAGLVWWGGKAGGLGANLPTDIQNAVAAQSPDYPVGGLVNAGDYTTGSATAKVTLVEFSDFECPYCKETHPVTDTLRTKFSNDDLRLVFRDLPIVEIHPEAYPAARAAAAAAKQGKFAEYADDLFINSSLLGEKYYLDLAKQLGLDVNKFDADRRSNEIAWQAYRARELFKQLGWPISTPTLVINGQIYKGDRTVEALTAAINAALGT